MRFDSRPVGEQVVDYKTSLTDILEDPYYLPEPGEEIPKNITEQIEAIEKLEKPTYSYLEYNPETKQLESKLKPYILNKAQKELSKIDITKYDSKEDLMNIVKKISGDILAEDEILQYQIKIAKQKIYPEIAAKAEELEAKYDFSTQAGQEAADKEFNLL